MSKRTLTTRKENGKKVAYLEPGKSNSEHSEFVPRGAHIKRIIVLSQAAYNALTPDAYTLYLIEEA